MATVNLSKLLEDVKLKQDKIEFKDPAKDKDDLLVLKTNATALATLTDEQRETQKAADRFLASMATLLYNIDPTAEMIDKPTIQKLVARIDQMVNDQINEILHDASFREMEATWTSIEDLVRNTNFKANIDINLLLTQPVFPGERFSLALPDVEKNDVVLYFFFTHPDPKDRFRVPLQKPLPAEVFITLGEQAVDRVQMRRR